MAATSVIGGHRAFWFGEQELVGNCIEPCRDLTPSPFGI